MYNFRYDSGKKQQITQNNQYQNQLFDQFKTSLKTCYQIGVFAESKKNFYKHNKSAQEV